MKFSKPISLLLVLLSTSCSLSETNWRYLPGSRDSSIVAVSPDKTQIVTYEFLDNRIDYFSDFEEDGKYTKEDLRWPFQRYQQLVVQVCVHNRLFVRTLKGVFEYDFPTASWVEDFAELEEIGEIKDCFVNEQGHMVFVGSNGLSELIGSSWIHIPLPLDKPGPITVQGQNEDWVLLQGQYQIFRMDATKKEWVEIGRMEHQAKRINSIWTITDDNKMVFGTLETIFTWEIGSDESAVESILSTTDDVVVNVHADKYNRLWIVVGDSVTVIFPDNTHLEMKPHQGLLGISDSQLVNDNLYVATNMGIYYYDVDTIPPNN